MVKKSIAILRLQIYINAFHMILTVSFYVFKDSVQRKLRWVGPRTVALDIILSFQLDSILF
jgi:hypothetical protein